MGRRAEYVSVNRQRFAISSEYQTAFSAIYLFAQLEIL